MFLVVFIGCFLCVVAKKEEIRAAHGWFASEDMPNGMKVWDVEECVAPEADSGVWGGECVDGKWGSAPLVGLETSEVDKLDAVVLDVRSPTSTHDGLTECLRLASMSGIVVETFKTRHIFGEEASENVRSTQACLQGWSPSPGDPESLDLRSRWGLTQTGSRLVRMWLEKQWRSTLEELEVMLDERRLREARCVLVHVDRAAPVWVREEVRRQVGDVFGEVAEVLTTRNSWHVLPGTAAAQVYRRSLVESVFMRFGDWEWVSLVETRGGRTTRRKPADRIKFTAPSSKSLAVLRAIQQSPHLAYQDRAFATIRPGDDSLASEDLHYLNAILTVYTYPGPPYSLSLAAPAPAFGWNASSPLPRPWVTRDNSLALQDWLALHRSLVADMIRAPAVQQIANKYTSQVGVSQESWDVLLDQGVTSYAWGIPPGSHDRSLEATIAIFLAPSRITYRRN